MFTIEEDRGTYRGPVRRHNGYYAGDFTRSQRATPGEIAKLARLQAPTFPTRSTH
ncbi:MULTISPECIES: hypothetical protein [unclassified Nocardioides]|uniref:hypothetical protein n=1 Tax=unclassified Nocardioides TaxID=2615069 RepID=UPI000AB0F1ED|nr:MULTISPECIES: hypothetical protein [unclassified Nocardioides]